MQLFGRFWVLLTVPVVLCLGVYGAVGARVHRAELVSQAEQEVRDTATLLAITLSTLPPDYEEEELHRLAERLTRDSRVLGVGLYDRTGSWLGGSKAAAAARAPLHPLVHQALERRADTQHTLVVAERRCVARIDVLSAPGESPVGALTVLRDLAHVDDAMRTWVVQLATVAAAIVGVIALFASLVARRLARTVTDFSASIADVTAGNLDARVPVGGPEEWRTLGATLQALIASLRAAQARLAAEEATRSTLEDELNRAQMLAVAGQVAATLGHEIGSPLNVILGRARLAAERDDLSDDVRNTFNSIASQCARISKVVSQLLTLARPPSSSAEAVTDASVTAQEVVSFLSYECRKRGIKARVEAPSSPVRARVGHDRLFQVLFNLAMNALQAQPHGGALVVTVSEDTETDNLHPPRRVVRLVVRDAGPGVPEALRGKVFDPFFSTRLSEGGTGLGLAVVAGIVRDLDGRVTVDANPDDPETPGAAFTVTLPAAGTRAVQAATDAQA